MSIKETTVSNYKDVRANVAQRTVIFNRDKEREESNIH